MTFATITVETITKYSLLIFIAMLADIGFVLLWAFYKSLVCDNFRKNLEVGSRCIFYIGEEKTKGIITGISQYSVYVNDEDGDSHKLVINEIYPT